jgi:hypothetical protein
VDSFIQALLLGHIAEDKHHTLSVLEVNIVFSEGNQLGLRLRFLLTLAFLLTMIFLFGLTNIQLVDFTENEVTVASHSGINETHLSIDLCVYKDGFVNKCLKLVFFLFTNDFNQSFILKDNFKWNLVITLSLRCIHEACKAWVNKSAVLLIKLVL